MRRFNEEAMMKSMALGVKVLPPLNSDRAYKIVFGCNGKNISICQIRQWLDTLRFESVALAFHARAAVSTNAHTSAH